MFSRRMLGFMQRENRYSQNLLKCSEDRGLCGLYYKLLIIYLGIHGLFIGCISADIAVPQACFLQSGLTLGLDDEVLNELGEEEIRRIAGGAAFIPADGHIDIGQQTQTFTESGLETIPEAFDDIGVDGRIFMVEVQVTAQTGLEDFSIIDRIAVSMATIGGGLPTISLAACDVREGCDNTSDTVFLKVSRENLIEYFREGTLLFELALTGALPLREWSFDVDICVRGEANYTL